MTFFQPAGYNSGSAIVFSKGTIRVLAEKLIPDGKICPIELPALPDYRFDDVAIARCLAAV